MTSDEAIMDEQRMAACPPHLRMNLLRQSALKRRRDFPEFAASGIALEEAIRSILLRMGLPDPVATTTPAGKPIDLKWHRRRWLP